MKFSKLVEAFETYTGVVGEIDDAELAIWFSEAQLDLALDFGIIKTVLVQPDENGVATLPADSLKLLDCDVAYGWNAAGQLAVGTTDPISVTYRAMPSREFLGDDPDQVPELPSPLHYLLAIFAAARYWDRESEGDTEEMNLANKWMATYNTAKRDFIGKLNQAGAFVDRWIVEDY